MKKIIGFICLLSLTSTLAFAKKDCTAEPKDKWMKEEDFKAMAIKDGFTIKKFKISGNCYEIYGMKEGKKVEVYFNPVDGSVAKAK